MRLWTTLALMLVCADGMAASAEPAPTTPAAGLSPREVVTAQLAALRLAGEGSAEAYTAVYSFASPRNQAITGPLPRFALMLQSGYQGLLTHRRVRHYFPVSTVGNEATQRVTVEYADRSEHDFLFFLRREPQAPCAGCWLSDGVEEVPVNAPDGLPGGQAL